MIANVLILNEMTTEYRIKFNSGYKNALRANIEDNIVKFKANYDGSYLSKQDKKFLVKCINSEIGGQLKD